MSSVSRTDSTVKVTIALPRTLVDYADQQAAARHTNRSRYIASILRAARQSAEDELAREGYRFYAAEAAEFAESSARAVAEAIEDAGPAW